MPKFCSPDGDDGGNGIPDDQEDYFSYKENTGKSILTINNSTILFCALRALKFWMSYAEIPWCEMISRP